MPYANKELRLSRINFHNNYANLAINPQTFENLKDLTIYIKDRSPENRLFGILLHDDRTYDYSITITAKSGNIAMEDNSALLYMETGTIQKFNKVSQKSEILNFDNYVFNLTQHHGKEEGMRWKAKERYLDELINPNDTSDEKELAKYRAEFHHRLTYPLLPFVFSMIALTCILRDNFSRRGNLTNIILATFLATFFLITITMSYSLIESSTIFIPVLYCDILLFLLVCLHFMNRNSGKKR